MKFIEVTGLNGKILINVSQIICIRCVTHADRYNSVISTATGEIRVKETYGQLKSYCCNET